MGYVSPSVSRGAFELEGILHRFEFNGSESWLFLLVMHGRRRSGNELEVNKGKEGSSRQGGETEGKGERRKGMSDVHI